jgi:ribosomal protein S18
MIKTLRKKDINWKNLPFLVKFLNEAGKLMNKYQTRLPTNIHRRLAKSVKHARHMGLLPYVDYIRGFDKIPLTSTYNDFIDNVSTVIDKRTGLIKHIHQPSLEDKFTYSNFDNSTDALKVQNKKILAEKFKNSLKVEKQEMPLTPNFDQRELLRAHNYSIKKRNNIIDENNENKLSDPNEKLAFDRVNDSIKKNFNPSNLLDFYLSEKSYDYSSVNIYFFNFFFLFFFFLFFF